MTSLQLLVILRHLLVLLTPQTRVKTTVGLRQNGAVEAHKLLQVPELTPAPIPALHSCYRLLLILLLLDLFVMLNNFSAAFRTKANNGLLFE